ncbi:MAG: PAS domain-containing protein [Proteobacteria bacterium]|nr:PAS domain-containing protein [Pseudomonadota bacterium]
MNVHSRADGGSGDLSRIRIVGLGASAGGLEALEQFFGNTPPDNGLAFVVVQHLDPTHKAMLVELLQRVTMMPVLEAADSMRVEPDTVYVIPPNSDLSVLRGLLRLSKPAQPRGMRLPIATLFCSLALEQGDQAIGVVLSGMGSDGTVGLGAIKTQGGLTLAQQPESAQFDSMPKSAITAGSADIIGLPAELPQRIAQVMSAQRAIPRRRSVADDTGTQVLGAILEMLREHSKHDLSLYKTSTLKRRVERRIGVHGLDTFAAYEAFLRDNPKEFDLLFKEMLIGVTGFFRDPAVWQDLKESLPLALQQLGGEHGRLRAWVVGCSTGEEAYTVAMLFREVADSLPASDSCTLQIFATDLSVDAIAVARRGHYPARIAEDVSLERLDRFFVAEGDGFRVSKVIREMVLFAPHDVIVDPPFTRLDILCCRNLLIYFNAALQRRLLPLFHYILRPGGILVLGGSETVGQAQAMFAPLSPKSRIYRRSDEAADPGWVDFPVNRNRSSRQAAQESRVSQPVNPHANLQSLADQVLLQEFSPPAVLVNAAGDVIYISGRTGRFLEPAAGKANWNIHVMLRPAIRAQVTAALRQAMGTRKPVALHGLRLEDDAQRTLDVTVQVLQQPNALRGMVMIVFRDLPGASTGKRKRKRPAGAADAAAGDELVRSQEEIHALRLAMRASEEELQAANEELQSTNEELQSANEELTTSKEEAQSMNEELQTINSELQIKLDDLALAQSDMQNLLNSTDIATLFLDKDLNVRRFTDQVTRIIPMRDADIGRPLSDLVSKLNYPQLHDDAKETLRTLAFSEKEISTTDGYWFTVRIMPYRTVANVIQGAVITFVDITAAKELESRLRRVQSLAPQGDGTSTESR